MKMVSRITAIGLAGVAICYLGLSGYVWYHDNKRSKQADVQASAVSENNKVLGFLREKGCDYCHTPSAELPAYYYIPGAKQLMDYDIKLGYKSFNLEAVRAALLANKPVSQSDLNKIEWVMQYETMPPTRYTALHWAGKVSDEERAEILAWIAKRARNITPAMILLRSIAMNRCSPSRKNCLPMRKKWRWALRCITILVYRLIAPFHALIAMR